MTISWKIRLNSVALAPTLALAIGLFLTPALSACSTQASEVKQPIPESAVIGVENKTQEPLTTQCREPRPEMCTMEYVPVCGRLEDSSLKTYSNGCNACSDPQVVEYREGACE